MKNHHYDGNYERYKKKVIQKSTNQLNGAYRKLFKNTAEVYLKHPDRDAALFNPWNYDKVFKITINVGEQYGHYELADMTEQTGLVNIFNKETFEAIIFELDTIKDLVQYLQERQNLLSAGNVLFVSGEEKDMLAEFVTNKRAFPVNYRAEATTEIEVDIGGAWQRYLESKALQRKREADAASYFIDDLVKNNVLKEPDGEFLAKELMNMSRFERRMLAKSLFSLVEKYQDFGEQMLGRRYLEFNGIGHLLVYYPPDVPEKDVDRVLQLALPIYAYKTNYREKEIILLAATNQMKQWKFGFYSSEGVTEAAKPYLEEMIKQFGWFQNEQVNIYYEDEYPE